MTVSIGRLPLKALLTVTVVSTKPAQQNAPEIMPAVLVALTLPRQQS